jgi:hypothetical protein
MVFAKENLLGVPVGVALASKTFSFHNKTANGGIADG